MVEKLASPYHFAMIMSEQWQPASASRVVFRRLQPAPRHSGNTTICGTFTDMLPYPAVVRAARLASQTVRIPNWMLAVSCAAALGLSMTVSTGLMHDQGRSSHVSVAQYSVAASNQRLIWSGSTALAQTNGPAASASTAKIATLQGQVQSMNSEIERLQRDNDALRNLTQQQSVDLTQARSTLAASQDTLSGQSHDLNSRLSLIQQDVNGRLSQLQGELKSADGIVRQIRQMLGMPSAPS